ncbi:Dynein light chain 2, cytoplasmic [Boothiomyces sp. JEL0838]|nr:Dynein light chain 2, cytoplasmic [Boothiomyces sp. JEL0838]
MTDRKAVIKNADMAEEMQQDAVDCATQAMEKYNIEKDIAAFIKREFDKKYNPTWHCIVGRNFGSYVTHETKGPAIEEIFFRSCMVPIVMAEYSPFTTIFLCPMFFGIAHLHHLIEQLRKGADPKRAVLVSLLQFTYTSLFGFFATFMLIKTSTCP